jgi:hypothetical protein
MAKVPWKSQQPSVTAAAVRAAARRHSALIPVANRSLNCSFRQLLLSPSTPPFQSRLQREHKATIILLRNFIRNSQVANYNAAEIQKKSSPQRVLSACNTKTVPGSVQRYDISSKLVHRATSSLHESNSILQDGEQSAQHG